MGIPQAARIYNPPACVRARCSSSLGSDNLLSQIMRILSAVACYMRIYRRESLRVHLGGAYTYIGGHRAGSNWGAYG